MQVLDRMCADALEALRPLVFAISLGPDAAPLALVSNPSAIKPSIPGGKPSITGDKPSNGAGESGGGGAVPNPDELRAGRKGVRALCEQYARNPRTGNPKF